MVGAKIILGAEQMVLSGFKNVFKCANITLSVMYTEILVDLLTYRVIV